MCRLLLPVCASYIFVLTAEPMHPQSCRLQRSVPPPAQELIKFSQQKELERDASANIKDFLIPQSSQVRPERREMTLKELWSLEYVGDVAELLIVATSAIGSCPTPRQAKRVCVCVSVSVSVRVSE